MKMVNEEQKRSGLTEIMSVSVSKEFFEAIKNNNLSPTEIFKKGAVIEFYEKKIQVKGQGEKGEIFQQRYKKFRELFQSEEMKIIEENINNSINSQINLLKNIKEIKERIV